MIKKCLYYFGLLKQKAIAYAVKNEVDVGPPVTIYIIGCLFAFTMSWDASRSITVTVLVFPFSWLSVIYYMLCGG